MFSYSQRWSDASRKKRMQVMPSEQGMYAGKLGLWKKNVGVIVDQPLHMSFQYNAVAKKKANVMVDFIKRRLGIWFYFNIQPW